MDSKSTPSRSTRIHRCRLPLPLPPPPPPVSSFVAPPPPPYWDEDTYIYTQTLPPLSSFPPPPPSYPFWDNSCIYSETLHQPLYIPPPPPSPLGLVLKILIQIEYYFCDDNLVHDTYLKKNMDDNGWVPITLIAGFRRVLALTKDIPLILDSLKYSDTVEVDADKVRRRETWKKWIIKL